MHVNIGGLLATRARISAGELALIEGESRSSFVELNAEADRLAQSLRLHKMRRGDCVAAMMRNSAEYVALYYAAAKIDAILVGINWRLSAPEVAYILADCDARVFFHDREFETVAETAAADRPACMRLSAREKRVAGEGRISDPGLGRGGDEPLILVYTSGTTGRPKGAVLTHNQMYWACATMSATHDYHAGDLNMMPVPLFHVGGLSFATLFVHSGATLLPISAWDPGSVLEIIEREHVTHFFAVEFMLRSLLEHPRFRQTDLRSLRWIAAGGAPVPFDLIRRFAERDIPVLHTYGATETAGPVSTVDRENAVRKAGSVGRPYFHTEVRISDPKGNVLRPDRVGEIQVRAPYVFAGYWQKPEATRLAFDDRWFKTGDLGRFDHEGFLYVVDRATDMIISGGENIYPAEIEAVLAAHPAITEAAVVGLPDGQWGEVACAIVVARDGAGLTLDSLREFCAGKIARYKIPRRLELVAGPLPRNVTGKLLKHVLRERIA